MREKERRGAALSLSLSFYTLVGEPAIPGTKEREKRLPAERQAGRRVGCPECVGARRTDETEKETERANRIFLTFPSPPSIVLDTIRVRCLRVAAREVGRRIRGVGGGGERRRTRPTDRARGAGAEGRRAGGKIERKRERKMERGSAAPPPFLTTPTLDIILYPLWPPSWTPHPPRRPPATRPERPVPRVSLYVQREEIHVYVGRAHRHAERYNARVSRGALLPASFHHQRGCCCCCCCCCCADNRTILFGHPPEFLRFSSMYSGFSFSFLEVFSLIFESSDARKLESFFLVLELSWISEHLGFSLYFGVPLWASPSPFWHLPWILTHSDFSLNHGALSSVFALVRALLNFGVLRFFSVHFWSTVILLPSFPCNLKLFLIFWSSLKFWCLHILLCFCGILDPRKRLYIFLISNSRELQSLANSGLVTLNFNVWSGKSVKRTISKIIHYGTIAGLRNPTVAFVAFALFPVFQPGCDVFRKRDVHRDS